MIPYSFYTGIRLAHRISKRNEEDPVMKKLLAITSVLLLIAVFSTPSFAFHGRGHGEFRGGYCTANPRAMAQLNLTDEQTAKINDLRTAHLKEIKPLRDKMFSLKGDLRLLWLEKNPDQAKIAAVQKEIRSLRDRLEDKRTAHQIEVLKILTPEQQTKFKQYCAKDGFGPRHGRGPGGYGPGMMNR